MKIGTKKLISMLTAVVVICSIYGGITVNAGTFVAGSSSLGGIGVALEKYYDKAAKENEDTFLLADPVTIPENVAIANVNDYLNIRSEANTKSGVVGILPRNGMCVVLEEVDGQWVKIKSGSVTGYVSKEYLFTGEEGYEKASSMATLMATVKAGTVNFRSTPSTKNNDNIITSVSAGEALAVIEEAVISKEDEVTLWVKVELDNSEGYISRNLVDVAYDWVRAVSMTSIVGADSASGLSSLRASLVIEAKKHIGLKYVWGGESLKYGADCSGFCRAVYSKCGISLKNLPRTSADMARSSYGKVVSLANAKPGDLVFYGDASGHVNHVAMYIGGGMIIHESGVKSGCKISSVYYRKPLKVKNFID